MGMTNAGINLAVNLLTAGGGVALSPTSAFIGVGDSGDAFLATQTDLQAAVNKFRKEVEAGYPVRETNTITLRIIADTGDANFDWNEIGIFNDAVAGDMIAREVVALGTKNSSQVWQLTATINFVPVVL